ncbi:uncharacterized protein LOC128265029 [Drosophila gunungcola]|uniref:uncharacterized protein LOC128265029 n=1 Tax=Drosophila gunungcola TaxID=103775 RepID=UPI0022E6CAC0|nr:uncharacterized protein LOC128265029 [Drosophila gunungcola]
MTEIWTLPITGFALSSVPSTIPPCYVSIESSAILFIPSCHCLRWRNKDLPACVLSYCLERNARRKLATVYGHDKSMPEETVETFFPFDPYLLKISNQYIEDNYMAYQSNETEDDVDRTAKNLLSRKRGDSELCEEDDFITTDKRQKHLEMSKTEELDKQFHCGP